MLYYVVCFGGAYAIIKDAMLYCIVCLGGGGGVNKRLSRMLCCIVLYVWGVHTRLSRMLCCIALYVWGVHKRILTNSLYKLCFYPLEKPNHRTPFTTALRGVKKVFAGVRGQLILSSVRSRLPLATVVPLGYQTQQSFILFFCAAIYSRHRIFALILITKS